MVAVGFGELDLGIGYIFDLIQRSARNCQLGFTDWADAMTFSWLGLCDMSMPDETVVHGTGLWPFFRPRERGLSSVTCHKVFKRGSLRGEAQTRKQEEQTEEVENRFSW